MQNVLSFDDISFSLICVFLVYNSQRSTGLSRALIFTCTARRWCESSLTFTSRQMLSTQIAHTHLDGAYKGDCGHTIATKNRAFTAVRQHGLPREIVGSVQRATMHSHILRASASGQRCWIQQRWDAIPVGRLRSLHQIMGHRDGRCGAAIYIQKNSILC